MFGSTKPFDPSGPRKQSSKLVTPLLVFLAVCLLGRVAEAQYGGGMGEPNDPYLIYTAEQMNAIGAEPNDWDKHFELMSDIDLSGYRGTDFNIIGYYVAWNDNKPFTGVFDGNGHTISNFTYASTDTDHVGLFAFVSGAIKNLGLIDPHVDAGIGQLVGSLVGYIWGETITNCYAQAGSVSGGLSVGGLVGNNQYAAISNCYSSSNVAGDENVGGLVGRNLLGGLTHCYSTCAVGGDRSVGGLVGHNQLGSLTHCYCTGKVGGGVKVGGLVGENWGSITHCYSTGEVSGGLEVGGLVGFNDRGYVTACYSTGAVRGSENVGGLVGRGRLGRVSGSFWDIQTSGLTTSAGGMGLTTAGMQTASIFLEASWDFVDETENGSDDIWCILEGQDYPRLVRKFSAFSPHPHDGATDVTQPLILRWALGESALKHDVYLGEDGEAVKNATTGSSEYKGSKDLGSERYYPGNLALDTTYYWRIDEVNEADPNSPWKGKVWSFTTAGFLIIVDDFESYSDLCTGVVCNRIYLTWIDGYGIATNGSIVGYDVPPFCEQTIVHGGNQSMPFFYSNTSDAAYSETERTFRPAQDWTQEGVEVLSLWFYGDPDNTPGQMYVKVNGTKVAYDGSPGNLVLPSWQVWNIDLASVGTNLQNVTKLSIGIDGSGASGKLLFDDIRLYRPAPEPEP